MTDPTLSNRVAIVVGAGGELGRATVGKLADSGLTVVGIDRSEQGLKELPDSIQYQVGDPTDPTVARSLVERIAAEVGPAEVLVNTIGTYHPGDALDAAPAGILAATDVYTASTAFIILESIRLDLGIDSQIHP